MAGYNVFELAGFISICTAKKQPMLLTGRHDPPVRMNTFTFEKADVIFLPGIN